MRASRSPSIPEFQVSGSVILEVGWSLADSGVISSMPENEHEADVNSQDEAGPHALMHAADLSHAWDLRRSSMVEPTPAF
jgi:hypothetical protein